MKITKSELKEIIREELLKEASDHRAMKDFMKELKKRKIEQIYQYDNDQIVIWLHNGGGYIVGNIRNYEED